MVNTGRGVATCLRVSLAAAMGAVIAPTLNTQSLEPMLLAPPNEDHPARICDLGRTPWGRAPWGRALWTGVA